ncbi:uncharacterized protein LOC111267916 isoform X2 [Varroa jacobsoni]|uniref:PDZ domain-containing protein n=1 Tax=Varroa destructor TaxID=109461 RepID=A0A7M7KSF8_VARDE|nr:uncharacterized protein LOC111253946 isoform X2 [Varroa destructor]XP_022702234.1 uncharacterized protein LOC111267916 isoform X2 [Varroa jacobsoni]
MQITEESSPKWDYIQQTKRHLKDRLQRRTGNAAPAVTESTIQYQGLDSLNSGSSGSPCGSPSSTISPLHAASSNSAGRCIELHGGGGPGGAGGPAAAHNPNTFTYSTADLTDVIVLGSRWSSHRFWCFGLSLDEVIAEDGKKWVYIKRIVPRSAADRSLCVQLDVICSVNDQGVKHKSRDRVRELISQSGENLLLKVVTANPVRLANTRKDILQVIERYGTVTLEAYGNPSYCGLHVDVGFKFISTVSYSAELKKFVTVYVISEVDGRRYMDLSQKQCLFMGDVLVCVNRTSIIDVSRGTVNKLIREYDRFTIKVAAMSVLRREVIKEDVRVKRRQLEVGDLDDSVVRPSGGLPPITTATNLSPTATSRHTPDPRHLQHQTPATSEGSATTALTVSSPDGCDSLQASSQLHNRINSSNTISESHNRSHTLPAVAAITNGGSSRS